MEGFGLDWRTVIVLLAAAGCAYALIALFGWARLRHRRPPAAARRAPTMAEPMPAPAVPPAAPEPAAAEVAPFIEQLAEHRAWRELAAEVQALRAEVQTLRQELADLQTLPRVSPIYADAMDLARRGYNARGIAEECGISIAEAELVLAMTRGGRAFDNEVDDDGNQASAASGGR